MSAGSFLLFLMPKKTFSFRICNRQGQMYIRLIATFGKVSIKAVFKYDSCACVIIILKPRSGDERKIKAKCTTSEKKPLSKSLAYSFVNLLAAVFISLLAQVFRFSKKLKFCCNMQYSDFFPNFCN